VQLAPAPDLEVRLPHDARVEPLRLGRGRHHTAIIIREHDDGSPPQLRLKHPLARRIERDTVDQRDLSLGFLGRRGHMTEGRRDHRQWSEVIARASAPPVTLQTMYGRVIVDYEEMIPAAADTEVAAWATEAPALKPPPRSRRSKRLIAIQCVSGV